jgi:hypothetical protein
MDSQTTKQRLAAQTFALEAYNKTKNHRAYALTNEARNALGILARAMFIRRAQEGRDQPDAKPTPWQEFSSIIERLGQAGVNLLQNRPGDAKPLPKLWLHPLSGEPLAAPKGPDERATLQRHDPELLRWFEEMRKHPYKTVAAHNAAEAQRQSLSSIQYGAAEHERNPFRGTNETAKGEFVKRDPELAAFYQAEARPVAIEIFGKNKNQTVVGKLAKDPSTAGVVQLAERIYGQWQAADKADALAARAKAEEELRRLAASAA